MKERLGSQVTTSSQPEGVLLVNKPKGKTSFSLIRVLRKLLNVKKIGHAGTLDPLATGVMVLMVGKNYTKLSSQLLSKDKEYIAEITLGAATDSYDSEGTITQTSLLIPSKEQVQEALKQFQGTFSQVPPMFSAKKVGGKKLYDLARNGIEIERKEVRVTAETHLMDYNYPKISLRVYCSKGTYIRSIAHDLGKVLNCFGHLSALERIKSGQFLIENCVDGNLLFEDSTIQTKQHIEQALIRNFG